jgi:hypothetical protein
VTAVSDVNFRYAGLTARRSSSGSRNTSTLAIEFLPHHLRNVSAVDVGQLLSPISPNFSRMLVPSKALDVERAQFLPTLQGMFEREERDDGLICIR